MPGGLPYSPQIMLQPCRMSLWDWLGLCLCLEENILRLVLAGRVVCKHSDLNLTFQTELFWLELSKERSVEWEAYN